MNRAWRTRLATGWCRLFGLSFVMGALTKYYWGPTWFGPPYSVRFAEWGYPSWFRFVVGTGELFAAIMLFVPRRRTRFVGCATLIVILVGAVITHIVNRDPLGQSAAAPTCLVIAAVMAWAFRPASLRELLDPPWAGAPGPRPAGRR